MLQLALKYSDEALRLNPNNVKARARSEDGLRESWGLRDLVQWAALVTEAGVTGGKGACAGRGMPRVCVIRESGNSPAASFELQGVPSASSALFARHAIFLRPRNPNLRSPRCEPQQSRCSSGGGEGQLAL